MAEAPGSAARRRSQRSGPTPDGDVQGPRLAILDGADERVVRAGFGRLFAAAETLEPHLRGVIEDTLRHPGSLVRAQLAYGMARGLGARGGAALELGLAIECFHTASLLFDDLPSMDDAEQRRGRPCPHRRYGEAATTLGALAFVARGYELLWRVLGPLPACRRDRAAALVARCLGVHGVLDGQARDLHFAEAEISPEAVERVAEGKTVTLIRLTLLLPAIVGGASERTSRHLERLAHDWGLVYQGLDDADDRLLSSTEAGKSTARDLALQRPNLPAVAGWAATIERLLLLTGGARETLDALSRARLDRTPLLRVQAFLEAQLQLVRSRHHERVA